MVPNRLLQSSAQATHVRPGDPDIFARYACRAEVMPDRENVPVLHLAVFLYLLSKCFLLENYPYLCTSIF
jgi:hypothetical protein